MSLRDKQEIGELRRQIAQLEVALGPEALTVLHPLMRENDRLSHSLIVARTTIERLQAQLKHANAALEAATNAHAPPQPDHSLAVLQTTEGVSAAARNHLLELYQAASHDSYMREALASLVLTYRRGRTPPPGTSDELTKALRVRAYNFFRWLRERSPLIVEHGRDLKARVIYALQLEHLGAAEFPSIPSHRRRVSDRAPGLLCIADSCADLVATISTPVDAARKPAKVR